MSSRRTERLLNLVICLLSTRHWLTKEQIRRAVPQYAECDSTEAFDRMFERDKEDLRELGIPLVTGTDSSWFTDETGYRVDRDSYALPDVALSAPELAVLGLASRVWQQATLAGPAARALVKLRALGVEPDEDSLVGLEPRIRTAEPSFGPLYQATRDRAPVAFRYRKPDGAVALRRVEPWAVTSRSRWWYLLGRDTERDAERVFRLSRIEGGIRRIGPAGSFRVPDGLDPLSATGGPPPADERPALLLVRPGRGGTLRLRAPEPAVPAGPDWEEIRIPVGDVGWLAEEIASHGPDVQVRQPQDLRQAVLRRLRGALLAQQDGTEDTDGTADPDRSEVPG
jgi:proteasome accessory factor B